MADLATQRPPTGDDILRRVMAEVRSDTPYRFSCTFRRQIQVNGVAEGPALVWNLDADRESPSRLRVTVELPHEEADQNVQTVQVIAHDGLAAYSLDGTHWGRLSASTAAYAAALPQVLTSFDDTAGQTRTETVGDDVQRIVGPLTAAFQTNIGLIMGLEDARLATALRGAHGAFVAQVRDSDPHTLWEEVSARVTFNNDVAEDYLITFQPRDFWQEIVVRQPEFDPNVPALRSLAEVAACAQMQEIEHMVIDQNVATPPWYHQLGGRAPLDNPAE